LEQREGRILRQGNQNDIVDIVNYVTEGTYDTVMWQTVQRKAVFIQQAKRNEVDVREVEDLGGGDIGESAAATKAIATGDPRYVKQVELEDEVKRLSALSAPTTKVSANATGGQPIRTRHPAQRAHWTGSPRSPNRRPATALRSPRAHHRGRQDPPIVQTRRFLAAACRAGYHRQDRGAAQWDPLGVAINGVEVLASRSLMHDTLILRLAVPSAPPTSRPMNCSPPRPQGARCRQSAWSHTPRREPLQRAARPPEIPDRRA
jgi:hypothetical protein